MNPQDEDNLYGRDEGTLDLKISMSIIANSSGSKEDVLLVIFITENLK